MATFMFDHFVCDECDTTNPEREIEIFVGGDYVVECVDCGGVYTFGNLFEDEEEVNA